MTPMFDTVKLFGAIVILCGVFFAGWGARGAVADRDIAKLEARIETMKAEHAVEMAKASKAALDESEKHRATEAQWQLKLQEAQDVQIKEQTALAAARDRADRVAVGLRKQLDAYTCAPTAGGAPAGDATASGAGPPSLGQLLDPVLQDYRDAVAAAEAHAADLRAVLAAWPRE